MPVTPYQPMRLPGKHVSHERMAEILAKRSGPKTQVASPLATPLATSVLQWHAPVKMGPGTAAQHSVCGLYRIDAVKSQAFIGFTCWRVKTGGLNKRLGATEDGPTARALAQADADAKALAQQDSKRD